MTGLRLLTRCVALLAPLLAAAAGEREVAALADPAGDDKGNGTLAYPQRDGFAAGDLDLTGLRIVRAADRYRFEATFRNPIRDPAAVAGDAGPESLAYFARRGFYEFNLDLYLDLDRVRGSGNTWTLPGRRVAVDETAAWERALIVTPRPELMRAQLADAMAAREGVADAGAVAQRNDATILFVTDVRVRGRTLSFEVPAAFLAGGRPDSDWSVVAFVTGAKTSIDADTATLQSPEGALDRIPLGVMQPKAGQPRDTFGYAGSVAPSPVVDLLAPKPGVPALAAGAVLPGVTWSASGAANAPGQGAPVTAPASRPAAKADAAAPQGDIAERLRRLDALRAQGLVSEPEYQELRKKILSEL